MRLPFPFSLLWTGLCVTINSYSVDRDGGRTKEGRSLIFQVTACATAGRGVEIGKGKRGALAHRCRAKPVSTRNITLWYA